MNKFDIIIIGAGASGLFMASRACKMNKSTCIIDMGQSPARKVAISGGGKCNFTNMHADYTHYFGKNPNFTRGALARFSPNDTLNWVKSHNIQTHEKTSGQFFADDANNIVHALLQDTHTAKFELNKCVTSVTKSNDMFSVFCNDNTKFYAQKLIIATGGISFTNLGTSDIGYKIAKQFGHKIIPPRPGLCGIKLKHFDSSLSGISIPIQIKIKNEIISDNMLFTHYGIGGPAIYRTSVRDIDNGFIINLLPDINIFNWFKEQKQINGKKQLKTVLSTKLPEHVAEFFTKNDTRNIADIRDSELQTLSQKLNNIKISPTEFSLQHFNYAECTRGGIDTTDISSKTMESKLCSNLYFIGEVLDIAGDLGGYNLQWAWSSANAVDI